MRPVKGAGTSSVMAGLCRRLLQVIWDDAAAASNALSEALIESSSAPLYSKRHSGAASASPGFQSVPLLALDRFLAQRAPPRQFGEPAPIPVVHILEEADAYLARVPGGGALLNDLVADIAHRTGYGRKGVRSVILQNFRSNGELVWK